MNLFVDTSALAKRYILENGSEDIDEIFLLSENIIISSLTTIEFTSALSRRLRDKSIDADSYEKALDLFNHEKEYFEIIPFDKTIEKTALNCVKKYGMKTLDSIQLSSAIKSKAGYFVTSDKKLHTIAEDSFKGESFFIGK